MKYKPEEGLVKRRKMNWGEDEDKGTSVAWHVYIPIAAYLLAITIGLIVQ